MSLGSLHRSTPNPQALVAVRVVLAPLPGRGHAVAQVDELRRPVELRVDLGGVRVHLRVVARPRLLLLEHLQCPRAASLSSCQSEANVGGGGGTNLTPAEHQIPWLVS